MDFVVFSDDWGGHPSSCQHIFRHLIHEHRVLWVNTVGMRTPKPSVSDLRKAVGKLGRMLRPESGSVPTARRTHPVVLNPFMLPFPDSRLANAWNASSGVRAVLKAMRTMGMERPVVVATAPNACDVVRALDAARTIYYCVDDFAQWPGHSGGAVRAMEDRLIDASDVIAAASPVLLERLKSRRPSVLLPHGVDVDLFSSSPKEEHRALSSIGRPRAGYYGLLDERLDEQLMMALADAMPDWSFVFAGPRQSSFEGMRAKANVQFIGPVAYSALPTLTAGLDALLLPYRVDGFTHTLSPLKLREYVLSGLPVISSPLSGVEDFDGLVSMAGDVEEWRHQLRAARQARVEERRLKAKALLTAESWSSRARALVELAQA